MKYKNKKGEIKKESRENWVISSNPPSLRVRQNKSDRYQLVGSELAVLSTNAPACPDEVIYQ